MAEVKWIKITTDMFDNRKIRHLRRLPDGNSIVLIWVMLLTMAGRCNASGMVFLTENIPYTPKMLADELGFEESTVNLALNALENLGMIICNNGYFSIAGWNEYQNIEGMGKIREQNRIRKQNQRTREKLLLEDSHVMSRDSHATDKDIDKEKDIDIEKPKRDRFVKPTLEEVKAYITEKGYNVNAENWFNYYESNGWKVGKNSMKNWQACIAQWNARENKPAPKKKSKAGFEARDYDYKELEKKIWG